MSLKRHELLGDLTQIGILWAAVVTVVFVLPDLPVSTKYLIAGLWSLATVIGASAYFGWDRLYARRSFVRVSAVGILSIIILLYTGYVIDNLALITWQWLSINGVLVVTWANLFEILLLLISVLAYYWSIRISRSILQEWEQLRQEEAEKAAKPLFDWLKEKIEESERSQERQ